MASFVAYLIPVLLGVLVLILLAGFINLMRRGSPNTSQKLMRARVIVQFVALVLMMVVLYIAAPP